jgi:hypothetical protein
MESNSESVGYVAKGMDFHKFYFKIPSSGIYLITNNTQ